MTGFAACDSELIIWCLERKGIYWPTERLLASLQSLCSRGFLWHKHFVSVKEISFLFCNPIHQNYTSCINSIFQYNYILLLQNSTLSQRFTLWSPVVYPYNFVMNDFMLSWLKLLKMTCDYERWEGGGGQDWTTLWTWFFHRKKCAKVIKIFNPVFGSINISGLRPNNRSWIWITWCQYRGMSRIGHTFWQNSEYRSMLTELAYPGLVTLFCQALLSGLAYRSAWTPCSCLIRWFTPSLSRECSRAGLGTYTVQFYTRSHRYYSS